VPLGEIPLSLRQLHMFRTGPGPTIVVVGLPEPAQGLLERLSPATPVWWLRLDALYGQPASVRSCESMIASYGEELLASGERDFIFIGFSMGGLLAAGLAARIRDRCRVHHTILIEPTLPGILPTAAKPRSATRKRWLAERLWEWATRLLSRKKMKEAADVSAIRGHLSVWTTFAPQYGEAVRTFELRDAAGPCTVIGGKSWLKTYQNSWRTLLASDGCRFHRLSTFTHFGPMMRRHAPEWTEVVRALHLEASANRESDAPSRSQAS
jgi:pimeloyl-ACP methyl ester carboxylesterase